MIHAEGTQVAVVLNPVAVEDVATLKEQIAARARVAGYGEPTWYETTREDPGGGVARAAVAAGAGLVIACGGDGTLAACAGSLAGTGVSMAVVAAGTGNLLARNLELPMPLEAALDVAFGSVEKAIDVLDAGNHRFVVMAGLGFDAALIRETDDDLKARMGWPAYLVGLVRAVKHRRRVLFEIAVDGGPAVAHRGIGALVGNVGQVQGGIAVLPDAVPDDGELDVIVFDPRSALDWPLLIWRLLRRRPGGEQTVLLRGKRVSITASHPLPIEFDGDFDGTSERLDVSVLPGALRLRVPKR
ncbi:MAG TPA: diacylglycerol kinase family protein [Jatrophihabitans sp.]